MKPELELIGVAGQKSNGKNEIAEYLVRRLGRPVVVPQHGGPRTEIAEWRLGAFADEVKDIYCKTFGVTRQFVEEWKNNPQPPPGMNKNVRDGLTFIGDGFREIDPDIWVKKALTQDWEYRAFADVRYFNELEAIGKRDGVTILVYRPEKRNYVANRSESELTAVLDWFVARGQEGPRLGMEGYHEYRGAVEKGVGDPVLFRQISMVDIFLRNDGSLQQLFEKVDRIVLSYLDEHYVARIV